MFKDNLFVEDRGLSAAEVTALMEERRRRDRRRVEAAQLADVPRDVPNGLTEM
jgi:hypothetical protein